MLVAGVAVVALWIASRLEGDRGQVTWTVDARAVAGAESIAVTIAVGDKVIAAHDGRRLDAPIRLVTPTPSADATITIDLGTAAGAQRVVRTARPSSGSTVAIRLGE